MRLALLACVAACASHARGPVPPTHPRVGVVDPFIGTDDGDAPDPPPGDAGGAVFPGATVPFGMIQWSPDTGPGAEFGYHYRDDRILGFSVTHLSGAGCAALLDFPFATQQTGAPRFRHADELATPGYYKVALATGATVELTAADRAAMGRFTGADGIRIDAAKTVKAKDSTRVTFGELRIVSPTRVVGMLRSERFCGHRSRYAVHLAVSFDAPIASEEHGKSWVWLRFGARVVTATIAISYVSTANAEANLDAALGTSFDAMRASAAARWADVLGRVEVEGGTEAQRRMFATALYHSVLHPNIASDVNGQYVGFDGAIRHADGYTHYATFSGWDIYRSWVQLISLLYPKESDDILRSYVTSARECGGLPRWALASDDTGVMLGDPGALIVANAHAFGAQFDAQLALSIATRRQTRCGRWVTRPGAELADAIGYVPEDPALWGSAALTLEYAVADAALSALARSLGDDALADTLAAKSSRWTKLFDTTTGFIRPRHRDGTWKTPWRPTQQRGFVEGNATQYTFFVPHDPEGLARLLGGTAATFARLDALFAKLNAGTRQPNFYIGNEPQFATPFLYARLGAVARTQSVVARIRDRAFTDLPSGLPGNDDLGALSSWFVWSALGLYPDLPGKADLALASPMFPRARVHLRDGSTLTITGQPGVPAIALDGSRVSGGSIPLSALLGGRSLSVTFREHPTRSQGSLDTPGARR